MTCACKNVLNTVVVLHTFHQYNQPSGLSPVNVIGDGNCFFRSVSHQLYGTERHHPQIRALAIQHLINCPEHFIEYSTNQSVCPN